MTSDPRPLFRATVTRDSITFNAWRPSLLKPASRRAARVRALERDVLIADVHVLRNALDETSELVITPLERVSVMPDFAVRAVERWATVVGHDRIWLPDRVIDVPRATLRAAAAHVTCAVCGTQDSAGGARFFDALRRHGDFPPLAAPAAPRCPNGRSTKLSCRSLTRKRPHELRRPTHSRCLHPGLPPVMASGHGFGLVASRHQDPHVASEAVTSMVVEPAGTSARDACAVLVPRTIMTLGCASAAGTTNGCCQRP